MGVLGHKAPQQLAAKTTGIQVEIFGNSARPLTARNDPKLPILGSFWGIAGRLRPARKFITFFYCCAINFFLRCLIPPGHSCLTTNVRSSAIPSSHPGNCPEQCCLTLKVYGTRHHQGGTGHPLENAPANLRSSRGAPT